MHYFAIKCVLHMHVLISTCYLYMRIDCDMIRRLRLLILIALIRWHAACVKAHYLSVHSRV
jgi:hypothetical protein